MVKRMTRKSRPKRRKKREKNLGGSRTTTNLGQGLKLESPGGKKGGAEKRGGQAKGNINTG